MHDSNNINNKCNGSNLSIRKHVSNSQNKSNSYWKYTSTGVFIAWATTMASTVSLALTTPLPTFSTNLDLMTTASNTTETSNQSTTTNCTDELFEIDSPTNQTLSSYPALVHFRGVYDVSFIAKINPFWLQFEPPTTRTYYILAVIYIIISSVGCIGNALVIFMFIRCKSLRTPANTLVINLAVSDLIMLVKCPIAIYNNFKQGPALGDIACRLYGFIGGLSGTASIGTLTAIAIDRYNVVVYPLDPIRKKFLLRAHIIISTIWIYSLLFSIVPALDIGLSVYVPEGFLTTCSFDYLDKDTKARIFMFVFFIAAWCIPLMTICYSYFYILKVVCAANRIQSSKDKNKTEQKLAMIVVAIIGLWFLAWTPYSIVAMLGVFGMEEYITPLGSMIPALFCKTAACIDPYIYAATHPRYRMEFRRLFYGTGDLRRSSTTRSSYMTRSTRSSRRLRTVCDVESVRIRPQENFKNNNLKAVPEVSEENDSCVAEELIEINDMIEQSKF